MRVARFLALATFVVVCAAVAARLWFEALPSVGPFGQRLSAVPRHSAQVVPATPEAAHAYALLQRARARRDAPREVLLPPAAPKKASPATTLPPASALDLPNETEGPVSEPTEAAALPHSPQLPAPVGPSPAPALPAPAAPSPAPAAPAPAPRPPAPAGRLPAPVVPPAAGPFPSPPLEPDAHKRQPEGGPVWEGSS